ncbi:MAG: helix-turn-helix domain-containing protein [Bacteroidales bacterium]|nr:helix-turn-helix domain-containing protein [Bacteroidales bacterium]MCI2146200.1 helix-turn-helix domain-containing protein [Bacteroidales bacterium]
MGIQRSGLSHILAGRNNPSYEFLSNLLSKFPDLSAEWLILGKGKMYKNGITPKPVDVAAPLSQKQEPDLFDQSKEPAIVQTTQETTGLQRDTEKIVNQKKIVRITIYYADGTYEDR